jgi:hypothetical protein
LLCPQAVRVFWLISWRGWKLWSKAAGWTASIVVGTLPSLVIYGAMAVSAMLK